MRIWPKRILYSAYGVAALVVALKLGLSKVGIGLLVAAPLVAVDGLLRMLAKPRLAAFSQELMALLAEGRDDALLPLMARQRLLLFAGPDFEVFDRQGLIYSHLGRHHAAAECYRDALEAAPNKRQVEFAVKLADSLREAEEFAEAERYYREVAAATDEHLHTQRELGRLILKRGGDLQEALTLLRRAAELAPRDQGGALLRAELALALVQAAQRDEARAALDVALGDLGPAAAEHPLVVEAAEALGQSLQH